MKIAFLIIVGIYALLNLVVAFGMSLKAMYEDFWVGQCWIGRICANLFFAMAWIIKGCLYALVIALYWVLWVVRYVITVLYRILKVLYGRAISYML
jgi:hypothetical protein